MLKACKRKVTMEESEINELIILNFKIFHCNNVIECEQ